MQVKAMVPGGAYSYHSNIKELYVPRRRSAENFPERRSLRPIEITWMSIYEGSKDLIK